MKQKFSFLKSSSLRLSWLMFGVAAAFLLIPDAAVAAITFGDMGFNLADNAKGMAKGAAMIGALIGVVMVIVGLYEMISSAGHRGEGSFKTGVVKICIGALLLALNDVIGSSSATLFGSDQTSGLNELGL